eukprot:TRINITY_DN2339_c4_g1_i1.p1 TRINITY_DN2339_c4_g1~~TRINITY_DN2339_c4_g1_i1.p1  ORF type:complete len:1039 (+),score=198.55 TRINITY_DN2339_c4_g1_i1:96-3212(+)
MGCGGSTEPKSKEVSSPPVKGPKEEQQQEHANNNEEGCDVTKPASAENQIGPFKFGDEAGDGSGIPVIQSPEEAKDLRRKTIRRSAVSQEVFDSKDCEKVDALFQVVVKSEDATKRLRDCLSTNPLFKNLLESELEQVIACMREEHFKPGEQILEQGKPSNNKYYAIDKGSVNVIKEGTVVATFTKGSGFGELELMYNTSNAATVEVVEDLTCFSLARDAYRLTVMRVSQERQKKYMGFIKKIQFLSNLTEQQQMTLADSLEQQSFKGNDKIIKFGSEGEYMHIICSGEVSVMGKKGDSMTEIAKLGPGDTIGELEFLHGHKCVADVIAKTEVNTLSLHKEHFELCMGPMKGFLVEKTNQQNYEYYSSNVERSDDGTAHFMPGFCFGDTEGSSTEFNNVGISGECTDITPEEAEQMQKRASKSEILRREAVSAAPMSPTERDQKRSLVDMTVVPKSDDEREVLKTVVWAHPLLRSLHEDEKNLIVDVMEKCTFEQNQHVLQQNDIGNDLHIITQGSASVKRDGSDICTLHKGNSIGELELMYDQPCRATVTAIDTLTTYKISRLCYKQVVMQGITQRRAELVSLLKDVDVLKNVTSDRMMMLADSLTEEHYNPKDYLLKHGEVPEWMHIILSGTVDVIGRDEHGDPMHVISFSRGSVVGELEFLNNHETVADVVATTPVTTGRLHRNHFERVLGSIADLLKQNATSTEYSYYQKKFEGFSFGDVNDTVNLSDTSDSVVPAPPAGRNKRTAVSAEVYDPDTEPAFEPVVFPKSDEEKDTIQSVLSKNILFSSLEGNDESIQIVINAMEKVKYSQGDDIMVQNAVGGEHWYIIEAGTVEVWRDDNRVATFSAGQGFGEMELMYSCPTAATVKAKDDVACWRLNRSTYRHIILNASQRKRQLCHDALKNVSFLDNMNDWQRDHLADALQFCTWEKGERILCAGVTPSEIHIIVDGEVEVVDSSKKVCTLSYGEVVGHLEFLNQHSAVADVIATCRTKTLKLGIEHFELCLGPVKEFLQHNEDEEKYAFYRQKREESMRVLK